ATGPREGHRPPGSRAIRARPVLRRPVSRGVDYTSPDPDGHTPAWYAQLNWPILEYLFSPEATADPGARTAARELPTLVGRGHRRGYRIGPAARPRHVPAVHGDLDGSGTGDEHAGQRVPADGDQFGMPGDRGRAQQPPGPAAQGGDQLAGTVNRSERDLPGVDRFGQRLQRVVQVGEH